MIDTTKELQKQRTKKRDEFSDDKIEEIIKIQATREQRVSIANDIIENVSALEELEKKVKEKHKFYLAYNHCNKILTNFLI